MTSGLFTGCPQHEKMRIDSILNHDMQEAQSHHSKTPCITPVPGPHHTTTSGISATQRLAPKITALSGTSGPRGDVNFPPFEDLDAATRKQVQRFEVFPLSGIHSNCRHIPYNSGKKDFQLKTGRDSFEVYQYTFMDPHTKDTYTVMWDYNVGLVRMTPFFKCCGHPKTMPAKMLNLNPGLKNISHSITGGSIIAQGYWLPYDCAKAVCATFCHKIAPALVPIFGSDFPASCIPPGCEGYEYMRVDPAVVLAAIKEAEIFRSRYGGLSETSQSRSSLLSINNSPRAGRTEIQDTIMVQTPLPPQSGPGYEAVITSVASLKQSRTPLPRFRTRTYYPSPQTPYIKSPELSTHSSPASTAYSRGLTWARSVVPGTSEHLRLSPNSSRSGILAPRAADRERDQPHLQTPWSHNPPFPPRKRHINEISGGDDHYSTEDYTSQPREQRGQYFFSPPETTYSSSVYSGVATRDNSVQSSPRQNHAIQRDVSASPSAELQQARQSKGAAATHTQDAARTLLNLRASAGSEDDGVARPSNGTRCGSEPATMRKWQ